MAFVQEIKSIVNNIGSVSTNNPLVIEDINDIIYCVNAIVSFIDSMIPLNEKEVVETFEKLWANKHSKIGKIVRKEID